jgi:hypothetical protein
MPDVPNQDDAPQAPLGLYVPSAHAPLRTWTEQDILNHLGEDAVLPDAKTEKQKREELLSSDLPIIESPYRLLLAEGGPYDGEEMHCPPGGSEVVLPGHLGRTGDFHGPVIYELDRRPGGDRMVYVGQPDQTEAIAEEMASRDD